MLLEVGVELNLLGGHRLGLHCQLHAPLLGQPVYDAAGVFCVLGKVDHRTHLLGLSLELGHQLRQAVQGVVLAALEVVPEYGELARLEGGVAALPELTEGAFQRLLQGRRVEGILEAFLEGGDGRHK